jgi:DNA-binding NarL/FixJ family response regulator
VVEEAAALDVGAATDLASDVDVVLLDAPATADVEGARTALDDLGPGLVILGPPGAASRLASAGPPFAWAALPRDAEPAQIVAAVRAVAAGLVALDPELLATTLAGQPTGPLPGAPDLDELTAREREVLTLVAIGLTNKAIAQRLSISDHTVKFHVAAILAKLDAESRTEAVHVAARRGLLTL